MKGTPVPAGTTISLPSTPTRRSFVVKEPCDRTNGQWACVTHGLYFRNNLEADIHEEDYDDKVVAHEVVWSCYWHGPETVPAGKPVKAGVRE